MYLVLLGPPGVGKGTQAETLAQELGLAHLASGEMFREAIAQGTELGKRIKDYVDKGLLVPDELTIRLVLERLEGVGDRGVVLDGFPRTLEQARALDRGLKEKGKGVVKVVLLQVPQAELLRRLAGRWLCRRCQTPYHVHSAPSKVPGICDRCSGELYQREDDKEETVHRRLEVYRGETQPLIDYYRGDGRLVEVNGEGSPQEVGQRLLSTLTAPHHGRKRL